MRAYRASLGASLLALAAWTTGCFDDKGLGIEVDVGDNDVDQVELFVALKQQCARGNITPPPDFPASDAPDDSFICRRDAAPRLLANVNGHTATFRLEAPTQDLSLDLLIAVGLKDGVANSSSSATKLVIPKDTSNLIGMTLQAPTAGGDEVVVWPTSPADQAPQSLVSCVETTHTDDKGARSRSFIVPKGDTDCDGFPDDKQDLECAFDVFEAMDHFGSPNCTTKDGQMGSACMIGAAPCTDGIGVDRARCRALTHPICLPEAYCLNPECNDLDCNVEAASLPHISCVVPVGNDAERTMCEDHQAGKYNADDPLAPPLMGDCDDLQLGQLSETGFNQTDNFGGATMKLVNQDKCSFDVEWQSGTPADKEESGLVQVTMKTNTLLIPIYFTFMQRGPGPSSDACKIVCNFVGPAVLDPMFTSCAAP